MSHSKNNDYLLQERNKVGTERLNTQHKFILELSDGEMLVSSLIPLKDIYRVADIGTGTGIWLEDIAEKLDKIPSQQKRLYDGFDISSSQFPSKRGNNFSWSIHNVLEPFPKEYHSTYDLVHARLLLVALRTDQYETAIENMMALLKPNGYLQWDDANYNSLFHVPPNPRLQSMVEIIQAHLASSGYPKDCPAQIQLTCKSLQLPILAIRDFTVENRAELQTRARQNHEDILRVLLPICLFANGSANTKEQAAEMGARLFAEAQQIYATGVYPVAQFTSTVVQPRHAEAVLDMKK